MLVNLPRKVDEINTNLAEEITPRLDELRGQKTHYLKWKANDGEENRLQKFCVAYSFNQAETKVNSSEEEKKELEAEQQGLQGAKEEAEVSSVWYVPTAVLVLVVCIVFDACWSSTICTGLSSNT